MMVLGSISVGVILWKVGKSKHRQDRLMSAIFQLARNDSMLVY